MKRWLRTIKGKIGLIFVCMSFLAAVSILLTSKYVRDNYRERLMESEQKNLDVYARTLDTSVELLEESLRYQSFHHSGLRVLEQAENGQTVGDTVLWQTVSQVLAQFRSLTYVFDYVDNVFIYYPHQDLFINANANADFYANGILTEAVQTAIREEGIENTPGWQMVRTSSGWYLYRYYYIRKAYVGAWISCDKILKSIDLGNSRDREGSARLYLAEPQEQMEAGAGPSGEELSISSYLSQVDLYLVYQMNPNSLGFPGEWFMESGYIWMILAINLVTLLLIMTAILAWVSRPIKYLMASIIRISQGDTGFRIQSGRGMSQEFEEICESFNEMLEQLQKARIQLYEQEIDKNKTKLRYLSQQIRPHFMLNALNTVYNYSKRDSELTRKIVRLLSAYYRYVVNVDSEYVQMGEELKHIENYLAFQKIRYGEVLEYEIQCDSALNVIPIPPFLIESFIGNSLKYGVDEEDRLHISVRIEQTGDFDLKIQIRDQGEGFSEEALEAIHQFKETGAVEELLGVGIRNSIERLRLLYQSRADLRIYNDSGAVVEIVIHLLRSEERDEGEKHDRDPCAGH
ncbi:MAG: histidine kinase [Lachnospiraceae bacterium]|nr:histidine kinase [Lachnospiraceae bacterium]